MSRVRTDHFAVPFVATVMLSVASMAAFAGDENARVKAIEAGATQLGSDEIAERFSGKTVTFARPDEKVFLVHYGPDNAVSGSMVGGNWSDTGYWAVTNADSICLSWSQSDEGRLRCFDVLVVDGVAKKFNPDGSLAGDLENFADGKIF
jgi:hypothetical protein